MKRIFIYTAVILVFQLAFAAGCKEKEIYWNPQGKFPLLNADGSLSQSEYFTLSETPEEIDIVVLNFFAPGCKPCIEEVPALKKIAKNIETRPDVKFIALGSTLETIGDDEISMKKIAHEVHQFHVEFSIKYPSYAANATLLKEYGVSGFPETFILAKDKKGAWYVKRRFISAITEKNIYDYLPKVN